MSGWSTLFSWSRGVMSQQVKMWTKSTLPFQCIPCSKAMYYIHKSYMPCNFHKICNDISICNNIDHLIYEEKSVPTSNSCSKALMMTSVPHSVNTILDLQYYKVSSTSHMRTCSTGLIYMYIPLSNAFSR